MQMSLAQHANGPNGVETDQPGWSTPGQGPPLEGAGRLGEAPVGQGPRVPKPAGVGIRARRPAVRLELTDHRWWRSTKAVLCLAPMCSHPSEGSLRVQGREAKALGALRRASARKEEHGGWRSKHPTRASRSGMPSPLGGSVPHSYARTRASGHSLGQRYTNTWMDGDSVKPRHVRWPQPPSPALSFRSKRTLHMHEATLTARPDGRRTGPSPGTGTEGLLGNWVHPGRGRLTNASSGLRLGYGGVPSHYRDDSERPPITLAARRATPLPADVHPPGGAQPPADWAALSPQCHSSCPGLRAPSSLRSIKPRRARWAPSHLHRPTPGQTLSPAPAPPLPPLKSHLLSGPAARSSASLRLHRDPDFGGYDFL